jgi:hypothetical protein
LNVPSNHDPHETHGIAVLNRNHRRAIATTKPLHVSTSLVVGSTPTPAILPQACLPGLVGSLPRTQLPVAATAAKKQKEMLRTRPAEACRRRGDADHALMAMVQFRPLLCPALMAHQYRRGAIMTMFVIAMMMTMLMLQTASAFSISMKYQPPVKFSVSSLYGGRKSRQSASSSSSNPRQSAYAGTLSMPPPFEQRMREMILKAPQDGVGRSSADGRRRALPKNVIEVESLQEYKEVVVGNRKVVVVRFHASYCKVRERHMCGKIL